ncbi:putative MarR family transcriptional regulator [Gordonia malaquae NBRC 108250]|uniref:Putative MarR family transcriptional regulator n=2 Tax=Gordonia malaquae TaxID=410332 RepID=M3UTX0_GORML|nr:putative MarR family transcriptional regulator [Gordonia malaquae NBRC 108250]
MIGVNDGYAGWPTGRLLSMAARLVEHEWESVLREYDMSSAGLVVLHTVAAGPSSQREIARAARVTDQTASHTIERLVRSGYVTREVDPGDHRRRVVAATAAGRTVYESLVERERTDPRLIAAIGDSKAELRAILLKLIEMQSEGESP